MFRPISRKYDSAEHAYPKELDMLGAILRGMGEGGASAGVGSGQMTGKPRRRATSDEGKVRNGGNMSHPARHHRAVLGRRGPAA